MDTDTPPYPTRTSPLRRVGTRGLLFDAAIAVALAAMLVANGVLFTEVSIAEIPAPPPITYVTGVAMCLALALRRVAPLSVLVVVAVAFTAYGFGGGLDTFGSNIVLFVATVSAGAHGRAPARDWVRGIVIAGLFGTIFWAFFRSEGTDASFYALALGQAYTLALNVFYFGAAWVFGDQVRLRRERETEVVERTAELAARTIELEAERARSEEEAATAERLRIARELHDVLGHHVSVMGVQAGAARRILGRDPDRASDALAAIEGSSRQAVVELQRVLKLLREPDDVDGRGPLGALGRLDDLADEVRRAGVAVTLQVAELPADLPTDLDLAAVRVVQESLTNVLRHAGPGSSAWVKVRVADDGTIDLEVADDGRGTPMVDHRTGRRDGTSRGSGLRGMRERVELHGGTFAAGPSTPRGWRVTATIPHRRSAAAVAVEGAGR